MFFVSDLFFSLSPTARYIRATKSPYGRVTLSSQPRLYLIFFFRSLLRSLFPQCGWSMLIVKSLSTVSPSSLCASLLCSIFENQVQLKLCALSVPSSLNRPSQLSVRWAKWLHCGQNSEEKLPRVSPPKVLSSGNDARRYYWVGFLFFLHINKELMYPY